VARARTKRSGRVVLAFDLGGTKLRGAIVTSRGVILRQAERPVRQEQGFTGLIDLFGSVRDDLFLGSRRPSAPPSVVTVASAGPLHPAQGVLLDPTNFFSEGQSWGVLPLVKRLRQRFKCPVLLENDAAAAVLGEAWKGGLAKRDGRDMVAMTLGTGVGIGVIANGQLVRAGQGLHPELSHVPLRRLEDSGPGTTVRRREVGNDDHFRCGCGAVGCMESRLAGSHFVRRVNQRLRSGGGGGREKLGGEKLGGEELVHLARQKKHPVVLEAFAEYADFLAQAIRVLAVSFAPRVVVLSGGFSHAADLYLPRTRARLPELLSRYRQGIDLLPQVKVSRLQDEAGLLGATWNALQR
jgi:glucokinase